MKFCEKIAITLSSKSSHPTKIALHFSTVKASKYYLDFFKEIELNGALYYEYRLEWKIQYVKMSPFRSN